MPRIPSNPKPKDHQNQSLFDEINQAYSDGPDPDEKAHLARIRRQHRKLVEFEKSSSALDKLMDDVSHKAQERGLTPEISESILND